MSSFQHDHELQDAIEKYFVLMFRESVEALNAGDTERLLAVVERAFPDLRTQIDDIVAADDKVALRLTLSGTHEGDFQDIPATGRTMRYASHEFYRVADGQIAEEWICSDMASLFRQLS